MSTRRNKGGTPTSSAARTPLGLEIYQPTRLDAMCKYTVGSFIAAGAAFVAVNLSATSASADDFGFSGGGLIFTDSNFGSGGTYDFGTLTPTISTYVPSLPAPAPQVVAPAPNPEPVSVPVQDQLIQVVAPTPEDTALVAAIDQAVAATPAPDVDQASVPSQEVAPGSTSTNLIVGVNDSAAGVGGVVGLSNTFANIDDSGISVNGTPFVGVGADGTLTPGLSTTAVFPTGTTVGVTLTPAGDTETVNQTLGRDGSIGFSNNIQDQISVNGSAPLTSDGLLKLGGTVNTATGDVGASLTTPDVSVGYNTNGTFTGSANLSDNVKLTASTGPNGTTGGVQFNIPLGGGPSGSAESATNPGLLNPSQSLTDLQPIDSAIQPYTDFLGLPSELLIDSPAFTSSLGSGSALETPAGTDFLGLPSELLIDNPGFTGTDTGSPETMPSTETPQQYTDESLVASGDLTGLGITFEADPAPTSELELIELVAPTPEDAAFIAAIDQAMTLAPAGDTETANQTLGEDGLIGFSDSSTGGPDDTMAGSPTPPADSDPETLDLQSLTELQPTDGTIEQYTDETLVASDDLTGLGITFLADSRAQDDGSKPPVYVPRSDGTPEISQARPGDTPVEIYVPPPASSVIPTNPAATPTEPAPGAPEATTPTPASGDESSFDWGPVTFAGVGIPFGAYGKVIAGQSAGLPVSVAIGDAVYRSPIAFASDVVVRTALKNPLSVTDNEAVNRLFTAGVGGGVGVGIDLGVKQFYNPIASNVAGRPVNAASGLTPVTLGVLPVAETALQVGANAVEEYFGVCTPNSTDLATYACNSAIGGLITTATWAGGIAEDLKRQEIKRVTQENIDCGCSADGALTPEQDAQIQTNYKKVLRNVGLAVGTQSGVTALIGAPGKSTVVTENCPTPDGSYANCFAPSNGTPPADPPATGGDSTAVPPTIPPSAGGGAVRIDGAGAPGTTTSSVPACGCRADYEADEVPVAPKVKLELTWEDGTPITQPANVTPALAPSTSTEPAPLKPTPENLGAAPEDPTTKALFDGVEWVFRNGLWVLVKTGEIGGTVLSAPFRDWSLQP